MKTLFIVVVAVLSCAVACNKPAGPSGSLVNPSPAKSDAVQQKLQDFAGSSATNCGRLDVHATEGEFKGASDCAVQASQNKKAFYVGYDMPGMSIGVAGNADGKLATVQSQNGALTSGDCPAQLRVASSGRVTCFAPGDMGSMSGSHSGGAASPGMSNPHGGEKPAGHP
jgi:hypothetical protein